MNPPKNPPAFPRAAFGQFQDDCISEDGMSLRDYFAGQALAGLFAMTACHEQIFGTTSKSFDIEVFTPDNVASDCYGYADAMLIEREKGGAADDTTGQAASE